MALGGIRLENEPEFSRQLIEFGNETVPKRLKKIVQLASATALRSLVRKTPYGQPEIWAPQSLPPPPGYRPGKAKGGWQVMINRSSEADIERIDASGNSTIAAGLAVIKTAGPFDTVLIFNNTPYILELEGGYSTQAPSGMIQVTIAQLATLRFE
jgi:hypothetical protein